MVFTQNQVTAFFEDADQMGIPPATRVQLVLQGINHPADLAEFSDAAIDRIAHKLGTSTYVADPTPGAAPGALVRLAPFVLGEKSVLRLKAASELVRYYVTCDRSLTPANMRWNPVIKLFQKSFDSMELKIKKVRKDVPKITKTLPIIRWAESFDAFLKISYGTRNIPLAYVTRENVAPGDPPALGTNLPYSADHGSIEAELTALASHTDPIYKSDNEEVFQMLSDATESTAYAGSITPFKRSGNGRAAYKALTDQFAGPDKWESEAKRAREFLQNRKWTGQNNFTLEKFVTLQRQAFAQLEECSTHIDCDVPTGLSRVQFLLDAIQTTDPSLQAMLSRVKTDRGPGGLRQNFEAAVTILIPECPVTVKKQGGAKRPVAEISEVAATAHNGTKPKVGIGKTGVELRYYVTPEFIKLRPDQKKELKAYRDALQAAGKSRKIPHVSSAKVHFADSGKQGKHKQAKMKSMISAAVADALKIDTPTPPVEAPDATKIGNYLIALMKANPNSATSGIIGSATAAAAPAPPTAPLPPSMLDIQAIIAKARHG
jgi:hypothetical protein